MSGVSTKPLRSGELAKLTGLSPDSIRHYERIGILPKAVRTPSGYRLYPREAVERVRTAQCALQLGFSLSELAEILAARDNGAAPCRRVMSMAEEKLASLTRQIEDLRQTERYMRGILRQWRAQLAKTAPGEHAMLLHSLAGKRKVPPDIRPLHRRGR